MKKNSLYNSRIPVEVVLGDSELSLRDLSEIGKGTIIELNKLAGEPVTLKAAGEAVALGEVVVIDENFGIRLTEMLDQEE